MDLYAIITLLIVLSAIFGYINVRFLKLPVTIGLMIVSILFSVLVLVVGQFYSQVPEIEEQLVAQIDFHDLLLDGMLSFLLFAGALHVDFDMLRKQKWPIILFSTVGVLTSAFLVGLLLYLVIPFLGIEIQFIHCLLFGSLIAPTDPIAVLGILNKAGVPDKLRTKIVGESLFNDGVGVVIFLTIYNFALSGTGEIHISEVGLLFLEEVGGGILLGLVLGYIAYLMMRSIDDYEVEVMITLAIVMGGYLLASSLHLSGPLAMVVTGLMVGHERFRTSSMSQETERYVDKFWELIDVLMNAVLFVLIGLEFILIPFNTAFIIAGALAIPITLLCRMTSLALPIELFKRRLEFIPKTNLIMSWGGLRGGISIALALSLASSMPRDLILTMTYMVVIFSIVVQGLTVGRIYRFFNAVDETPSAERQQH